MCNEPEVFLAVLTVDLRLHSGLALNTQPPHHTALVSTA